MNIDVIVKPMERGQITLPLKFREKLGISKDTLLNITIEGDRLVVMPLKNMIGNFSSFVVKPKILKVKYLELLRGFNGNMWSKQDDIDRARLENKEKNWNW